MNDNSQDNSKVNIVFIIVMLIVFILGMLLINSCRDSNTNKDINSNVNNKSNVIDSSNKSEKSNNSNNIVSNKASNKSSNKVSNSSSNKTSNKTSNSSSNKISNSSTNSNNIKSNTFKATFVANGATINQTKKTCTTNGTKCTITSPKIVRDGYVIVGWSTNPNAKTAQVSSNSSLTLTKDMTYYAITKKELTLTIYDNDTSNAKIYKKLSCNIYNKATNCSVVLPEYNIPGRYNNTYGTKINYEFNSIMAGTTIKLSKDTNYYMLYHNFGIASNTKLKPFSVSAYYSLPVKNAHLYLDCEAGVSANECRRYYNLYKNMINQTDNTKNLLVPHKTFLLTNSTYDTISKSTNGLTGYNKTYGFVELRYTSEIEAYRFRTAVHESFHAWDGYTASLYGKRFTDMEEAKEFLDNAPESEVGENPNVHEWWAYFYADYYVFYLGKFNKYGVSGIDKLQPLDAYKKLSSANKKKAINLLAKYGIANKVS